MTLREAQALILLYQSCRDEALRRKVCELVPDLGDFEMPDGVAQPVTVAVTRDGKLVPLFWRGKSKSPVVS